MKRLSILILCLFVAMAGKAQKHEVGVNLGYGKGFQLSNINNPHYWQGILNCVKFDLNYSFIPGKHFAVVTGLYYQGEGSGNSYVNFIGVPIGIDILAGNKVQGVFGIGFNITYLAGSSGDGFNTEMENFHSDFQLGIYLEAGLKINLGKHSGILIKTMFDSDLTPLYWESNPSHSDAVSKSSILYSDVILSLGYRYRF